MARKFPVNFSSWGEYETYFTCLSKCVPGDKVEVYINSNGSKSVIPTNHKLIVTVIGQKREHGSSREGVIPLLGSNLSTIGFWTFLESKKVQYEEYKYSKFNIMKDYKYGYWANYGDIRIARIIKNETLS